MTRTSLTHPLPTPNAAVMALARTDPGRTAVIDRGLRVTYGEIDRRIRRCAGWLLSAGVAPADTVGLTIREELPHLVATLALLRLGCRQVTMASWESVAMRAQLAARLGVSVVLGDGAADAVPGASLLLHDAAAIAAGASLGAGVPLDVATGDGILVCPSSGTTGRPKLVAFSEGNLARQAELNIGLGLARFRLEGNEFNSSIRQQLQTMARGEADVLANNDTGESLAATCARLGVEALTLAPVRAHRLLAEAARPGAQAWPAATSIFVTGSAISGELRHRLQAEVSREIYVYYGSTESGSIARAEPGDHAAHPDALGRPVPGVTVQVVDEDGAMLPPGEPGHVRVRSAALVGGYLDDPEATARAFRDGWFHPGDVAHVVGDGLLILAGRRDDMMSLGTLKIFPAEIEAVARTMPGVSDCAAFAHRMAAWGDVPMLAVVAGPGFDAAALMAHCRDRLAVRAPRKVVVVPVLPRNPQGKVLRRDLAALMDVKGDHAEAPSDGRPPT